MEKKNHFKGYRTTKFVALALVLVLGIIIAVFTITESQKAIKEEQDSHLYDLASTVDYHISNALYHCRLDLCFISTSDDIADAEKNFIQNGNAQHLQSAMYHFLSSTQNFYDRIIASYNDELVSSSDASDLLHYQIVFDSDGDDLLLITDTSEKKDYLGIFVNSETNGFTYYLLIDVEDFYQSIVVNTVYEDYWIVFYDRGCGLVMHNDRVKPVYEFYSEEKIAGRGDGLTLIYNQEGSNSIAYNNYSYIEPDGTKLKSRIAIIPSSVSRNGNFSVAVAVYHTDLIGSSTLRFLSFLIAAFLIAFSLSIAIHIILNSEKRKKELEAELESLEKQNELTSQLLQQQEELAHHQKLETIGILTAGIAHEFNNLLSPIMGESLLILENTQDGDENFDSALDIFNASNKAKTLVSRISMLSSRNSSAQMGPLNISDFIDNVLSVASSVIYVNVTIEKDLRSNELIFGNSGELEHMLLNLILNSIHAMEPDGGNITITTWNDAENVFLAVADTGHGIADEDLERIFEPFYTTKESGQGTGLGLALARSTISNHKGSIMAENGTDKGAIFTITIPIYRTPNK